MTSYTNTISVKSQQLCTHYVVKTSLPLCIVQMCTCAGGSTCHQPQIDSCFAMQPVSFIRPCNYRDDANNIPLRDRWMCNFKNVTLNSSFTYYTSVHNGTCLLSPSLPHYMFCLCMAIIRCRYLLKLFHM
jgi:hypothetical protein